MKAFGALKSGHMAFNFLPPLCTPAPALLQALKCVNTHSEAYISARQIGGTHTHTRSKAQRRKGQKVSIAQKTAVRFEAMEQRQLKGFLCASSLIIPCSATTTTLYYAIYSGGNHTTVFSQCMLL